MSKFIILVFIVAWCLPVFAQPAEKALEVTADKLIPKAYLETIGEIKKIMNVNVLSLKLSAGMNGALALYDVARGAGSRQGLSSNNISFGSRVAYGVYPTEAEFNSNLSFEYVDNDVAQKTTFQETMSSFLVNVEQYFSKSLEGYGFIERFSNSYMGVDQRWEVGLGLKWEGDLITSRRENAFPGKPIVRGIQCFLQTLCDILSGREVCRRQIAGNDFFRMAAVLAANRQGEDQAEMIEGVLAEIQGYRKLLADFAGENKQEDARIAWKKKKANVQLDFAGSFFVDITHPSLTYTLLPENEDRELLNPICEKVAFDPDSKLRVSLRAGIVMRPSENSEISSKWYFKLPLTNSRNSLGEVTLYDLRIDSCTRMAYKIPIGIGSSKIELGLQLDYFYDRCPPYLDKPARKSILDKKNNSDEALALGIRYYMHNFMGPKSFAALKASVAWEI